MVTLWSWRASRVVAVVAGRQGNSSSGVEAKERDECRGDE